MCLITVKIVACLPGESALLLASVDAFVAVDRVSGPMPSNEINSFLLVIVVDGRIRL